MIHFLALAMIAGQPDPTPPKSLGAATLGALFTGDDYPPDAVDRNEQGRVIVTVHVSATGTVSSCEIKMSSGFPALDTRTCEIIAQRAKFLPAQDSRGNPVSSEITQAVVWALEDSAPSDPWGTTIILTYGADKAAPTCRMEMTGAVAAAVPPPCPQDLLDTMAKHPVPGAPEGMTSLRFSTNFQPGPAIPFKLGAGDILLQRSVAEMSVDATGHRTACKLTESDGPLSGNDLCQQGSPSTFDVRKGQDGNSVPFTATFTTAVVAHVGAPTPPRP